MLDAIRSPQKSATSWTNVGPVGSFGGNTLKQRFRDVGGATIPRLEIIPQGVDSDLFFPIAGATDHHGFAASRLQARQLLFGALLVVMMAVRPQGLLGTRRVEIT